MGTIAIDHVFQNNMDRFYTCSFTGHRPHKLAYRFAPDSDACAGLKDHIKEAAIDAIVRGYKVFICGGGLGVDQYAAETVLSLKSVYPYIRLYLALPCLKHNSRWTLDQRVVFEAMASGADKIVYVSERPYFDGCMHMRNRYLVDHASLLIAVYNGLPGGTEQTIAYAKKQFLDIRLVPSGPGN